MRCDVSVASILAADFSHSACLLLSKALSVSPRSYLALFGPQAAAVAAPQAATNAEFGGMKMIMKKRQDEEFIVMGGRKKKGGGKKKVCIVAYHTPQVHQLL